MSLMCLINGLAAPTSTNYSTTGSVSQVLNGAQQPLLNAQSGAQTGTYIPGQQNLYNQTTNQQAKPHLWQSLDKISNIF